MRRILRTTSLATAVAASLVLAALPATASAGTTPAAGATSAAANVAGYAKTTANLRSQATRASMILDVLRPGERVSVSCWVAGEPVYGTDKYGSMWLFAVSEGPGQPAGYVHSYLVSPVNVPPC
jgi:hypothetical protein